MTDIVAYHQIHQAACRWRRQGVVCSLCRELAERAERASCPPRPAGVAA